MIKASSLLFTLVISLLIAIVSSSLILFAYIARTQFQNYEINQQLNLNADSGLNLLLSRQSLVDINQQKNIDLYGRGEDSVELIRKTWGAYEIAVSRTHFKNTKVKRIAQVGYHPDSSHLYSMYIPDHNKPIALCGKTIIKGKAFLPKAGVKRTYIEGQSFEGDNLINGTIKKSESTLPEFNKDLIKNIDTVFSTQIFSNDDSVMNIANQLADDTLKNSFLNRTLVLKSAGPIEISGGIYSGNIVIISQTQITISSSTASIENVILFAPRIIIENEFKGNLQAFASDSIFISNNVSLQYPSVLGLFQNKKSPRIPAIVLNEGAVVSGNIIINSTSTASTTLAGLILQSGAIVNGQVYCNGFADIKGTINGSLMCTKIILVTPSSVYENHLLNATIDVSQLSEHYVGINLVKESNVKKVVKWLN